MGVILAVADGPSGGAGLLAPMSIVGIGYAFVGARVVDVRPRNPVGWLLIGTALSWGLTIDGCVQYAGPCACRRLRRRLSGLTLAAWIYTWLWLPGGAMLLVFVPLLFPTGRTLVPPVAPVRGGHGDPGGASTPCFTRSPTIPHLNDDLAALIAYNGPKDAGDHRRSGRASWSSGISGRLVGGRRRRPSACVAPVGIERQQIRWYGIAIAVAAVAVDRAGASCPSTSADRSCSLAVSVIPASIGIAMLRYRLYELDRLVSRTIAYAVVTATAGRDVRRARSSLLGGPLGSDRPAARRCRSRCRRWPWRRCSRRSGDGSSGIVDRRFDRARYDAEGMAAAFSERLAR